MGIQSELAAATHDADKTDFYEHDDSMGLHFPCSSCVHGDRQLDEAPCLKCRYFATVNH